MADEPTTPAEETPAERPEWLLERFQTPEAQAQAYAEAQAEMNRLRSQMEQERQSFSAALESIQTTPPPTGTGQQFDPAVTAYAHAYEQGDVAAMLAAQAEFTMRPTVEAVGKLLDERLGALTPAVEAATAAQREHDIRLAEGLVERTIGPDRYAEILPRIREIVADHPNYLPQATSVEGYRDAILNVAKLAEHDTLVKTVAQLEQERADKLAAQTLSGGYNRPVGNPDADRAEFERIKATPTGTFQELLDRGAANAGR